jgi:transcriptional regulator with XRE-family HTH domain
MLHYMDGPGEPLAAAIGARVRQWRAARRWTLDQLAAATGVSRRLLVTIEKGEANPSIGTLLKISGALGVGLPALVEVPSPDLVKVTRAGEGAVLWHGEAGGQAVLLVGTEPPDVVELWDWTLGPRDRYESQPHAPGTRELLQVSQGRVVITLDKQEFAVNSGDAMTFAGDQPHSYANATARRAHFALAVFEPRVGTAAGGDR